jgi:hypothetical protein
MQLRRHEVAQAAEARAKETRQAMEQRMARHAAQAAAVAAEKAAQQARLRKHHREIEQHRLHAAQRRCALALPHMLHKWCFPSLRLQISRKCSHQVY